MFPDLDRARDEALTAIMQMSNALRGNADTAEPRHLDRLLRDRDEMLARAHFHLDMPIMDLAAKTGIAWTDLYDTVDAVRERLRRRNPWSSLLGPLDHGVPELPEKDGGSET